MFMHCFHRRSISSCLKGIVTVLNKKIAFCEHIPAYNLIMSICLTEPCECVCGVCEHHHLYGTTVTLPLGKTLHTGFKQMANLSPWGIINLQPSLILSPTVLLSVLPCAYLIPFFFSLVVFFFFSDRQERRGLHLQITSFLLRLSCLSHLVCLHLSSFALPV